MTTSATVSKSKARIARAGRAAYFQGRLHGRIYDLVMRAFIEKRANEGLTQKEVADRLAKTPAQINKLFAGPGNWTLDTVSNLLLAICDEELEIGISNLADQPARNATGPEWLTSVAKSQAVNLVHSAQFGKAGIQQSAMITGLTGQGNTTAQVAIVRDTNNQLLEWEANQSFATPLRLEAAIP